jgi:hypothetical protein
VDETEKVSSTICCHNRGRGYEIESNQIVSLSALLYSPIASTETRSLRHARFSVSIFEEGSRLGLKCLLLSYFRVGDDSEVREFGGQVQSARAFPRDISARTEISLVEPFASRAGTEGNLPL